MSLSPAEIERLLDEEIKRRTRPTSEEIRARSSPYGAGASSNVSGAGRGHSSRRGAGTDVPPVERTRGMGTTSFGAPRGTKKPNPRSGKVITRSTILPDETEVVSKIFVPTGSASMRTKIEKKFGEYKKQGSVGLFK